METIVKNGTEYLNFSTEPTGRALHMLPPTLQAEKVVFLPDLNPGRSPLPTGTHVVVDERAQPSWRELAISDVGCGMQVLRTTLTWTDFDADPKAWTELYRRLKANKGNLGDLGGGNHFTDAAVDDESQVFVVIHTGSRKQSPIAAELADKPRQFDIKYPQIVDWAGQNRSAVGKIVGDIYGKTELVLDKPHNFFRREGNNVLLYKGSMELRPGELGIIPSSMTGEMAIVESTEGAAGINYAISHGTGRVKSRSDAKAEGHSYDYEGLRRKILIPDEIDNASISTDFPEAYRPLNHTLELLQEVIKVVKKLVPIAYLGQI